MGLSSALFSGSSGLNTLGDTMQIIGDNIANVNTIGFKSSEADFQDLLSQSISTMNGATQIGSGSAIGDVSASFQQGSFKTTGSSTDLAIGGSGFFIMRESSGDNNYYSRAGNFGFDKDGKMVNPDGYVVQGWELDDSGNDVGSITDVQLSSFTSKPKATEEISVIANLDSSAIDNSNGVSSGHTLLDGWDVTATPVMDDQYYEYQTTVEVYDSLGNTHDITIYFDKTDTDSKYEYAITCNPGEDNREGLVDAYAGLLASGEIVFEPETGVIESMAMSRLSASDGSATPLSTTRDADGDGVVDADFGLTNDGKFKFQADFLGTAGGSSVMDVALNFGSTFDEASTTWEREALTTTQFSAASNTVYKDSDGYGAGDLQDVNVDEEGVISGTYSNGQIIPLYRVALADFQNEDGLVKQGGNLFSATVDSGDAITNKPGTNGLGSIAPGSLEQSNVDIADEFVTMITTQRGFQANSKIITTVDTMLSELMNLKR